MYLNSLEAAIKKFEIEMEMKECLSELENPSNQTSKST